MSSNTQPLFSIVVPTYNRAEELKRCLDSLVAQTYKNFEVLVCDDGSKDNSKSVADAYVSKLDIQYFWNENWGGPARPRNVGIAAARGEWICFLDSDDWWYPNKLEACLPFLANCDLLYHQLEYHNDKGLMGRVIGKPFQQPILKALLVKSNFIPNSAMAIRSALIRSLGGISEERDHISVEDYDMVLKAALRTDKFCFVAQNLGAYWYVGNGFNISAGARHIEKMLRLVGSYRQHLDKAEYTWIRAHYQALLVRQALIHKQWVLAMQLLRKFPVVLDLRFYGRCLSFMYRSLRRKLGLAL